MEFVVGTILLGLAVWGLNKVYALVHEKIDLSKSMVKLEIDMKDLIKAKDKLGTIKMEVSRLNVNVKDLRQKTLLVSAKTTEVLNEIAKIRQDIDKQADTLLKYGNVIVVLQKDYISRHKK